MDNLTRMDWDQLAFRISKFVKVEDDDDFEKVKKKLRKKLQQDTRGGNLTQPKNWAMLWREVVPRLIDIESVKKRLYIDSGGKYSGYPIDRKKTAQKVVTDFGIFKKETPRRVDMDGIDTKDGKFIKK